LYVFVGTGSFSDEHQISARIANAKDNLFAALFMQRTAGAVAEVFPDEAQGGAGIDGWFGGLRRLGVPGCAEADTLGRTGSDRAGTGGIERNRVGNRAAVKIVNAKVFIKAETFFERTAQFSISRHLVRFYTETQIVMRQAVRVESGRGRTKGKRSERGDEPAPHLAAQKMRAGRGRLD